MIKMLVKKMGKSRSPARLVHFWSSNTVNFHVVLCHSIVEIELMQYNTDIGSHIDVIYSLDIGHIALVHITDTYLIQHFVPDSECAAW